MVHLGDTASFRRVVRIYVEKDELLLRIRKKNLRDLSRSYSRLAGRPGGEQEMRDQGCGLVCGVHDKRQVSLSSWSG